MSASEDAGVNDVRRVDAHSMERWSMCDRRDDEPAVIFESDKATVEEMIDALRQKQSIFKRRVAHHWWNRAKVRNDSRLDERDFPPP